MCGETCKYVAKREEPDTWHGEYPTEWQLDSTTENGGLEIESWRCPHPSLEKEDHCIFHTEPGELPEGIDECEALVNALDEAGESPFDDGVEHRGQFVGATFGTLDLSGETIVADEYDVRFDHAQICSHGQDILFEETDFVTRQSEWVSFRKASFITEGKSDVNFIEASFTAGGEGNVSFEGADFTTKSGGNVCFKGADFITNGEGEVSFKKADFITEGEGHVSFEGADFITNGEGNVSFYQADFITEGEGHVFFEGVNFTTAGEGHHCHTLWISLLGV